MPITAADAEKIRLPDQCLYTNAMIGHRVGLFVKRVKYNKSSPKSFEKSASLPLTTDNGIAHFMCYELRNRPYPCRRIQSLSNGYATSTRQCHMHPIRYTALAVWSPNKFAPSLTGDINAQSSHWNNGKWKLLETFICTFTHKPLCVWLSLCQFPRNRYAKRLILKYKPIIFSNNVSLYINNQQTLHRLRPLALHWTSIARRQN